MMNRLRSAVALVGLTLVTLLVSGLNSAAFAAAGGDREKIAIVENSRDIVGLIFLGAFGLFTLWALKNAAAQLGGKREGADGRWRWR